MKNIYSRIFKNWKTTVFGLVIIAIGVGFVWFGKASMAELTAFISGALVLIFSKDE
jgi:multisubunit Na+/H+ antiporter MnhG subunit